MYKSIKIISYLLLITTSSLMAADDFDSLFCLQQEEQGIITIKAQPDAKLPEELETEEHKLTTQEEFYYYLVNYGTMQLYLTDYDSSLVIVPFTRKHIAKGLAVNIKFLRELNKPYFMFLTGLEASVLGDCNMASHRAGVVSDSDILVKIRSLTIKQVLSDDNVMAGIVNLLKYVAPMYKEHRSLASLAPINLASDLLVTLPYVSKDQQPETFQANCIVSIKNHYLDRNYLLAKMLGCDLASYLWLHTKCFSSYIYQKVKQKTTKQQTDATTADNDNNASGEQQTTDTDKKSADDDNKDNKENNNTDNNTTTSS